MTVQELGKSLPEGKFVVCSGCRHPCLLRKQRGAMHVYSVYFEALPSAIHYAGTAGCRSSGLGPEHFRELTTEEYNTVIAAML